MTIEQIKELAKSEMTSDGALSKGLRLAILEKAKEGEIFEIVATFWDYTRLYAELRRCNKGQSIRCKQADKGNNRLLMFNSPK